MTIRLGYFSEMNRNTSFGFAMDGFESQDKQVYEYLVSHGKSTAQEIAAGLGIKRYTSVHRSLNTLMKKEIVKECTKSVDGILKPDTRLNPETRKPNILWEITGKLYFKE
jgi:hypothetical protein